MRFKKSLISISLLLLIFVLISSVSAIDTNSSDSNTNNPLVSVEGDGNLSSDGLSVTGVGSDLIYISPNGTGTGLNSSDASNWNDAYTNIKDNGTLVFMNGTYNLVNQSISKNLTLNVYDSSNVILDASGSGIVFNVNNSNLFINGLTFVNGTGYNTTLGDVNSIWGGALYVRASNLTLNNCTFTNNNASYGGAIFSILSNIYINDSKFIDNTAINYGGAIVDNRGNLTNNNTVYMNNRALTNNAGAIHFVYGTIVNLNTLFYNNSASWSDGKGGAIRLHNGTIISINTSFIGNTAFAGGALNVNNGSLTNINCTYTGNSVNDCGGAIKIIYGNSFININSTFTNNTAMINGGALRIGEQNLTTDTFIGGGNIVNTNSIFTDNTAKNGGGICLTNGNITSTNCTFTGNKGRYDGGALLLINGLMNNTNCSFTNNTAANEGGAIRIGYYFENLSKYTGTGSIVNINSKFYFNTAVTYGGAISLNWGNITNKDTWFVGNNVTNGYGGAILLGKGNLINNLTYYSTNTAGYVGGAIEILEGNLSNIGSAFTDNSASFGGAIDVNNTAKVVNINTVLSNNKATNGSGGAIYMDSGENINYNTNFLSNNATTYGGAIYILNGSSNNQKTFYENNIAGITGGAIVADNITIHYSIIYDNHGADNNNTLFYRTNLSANNNWWGNNNPFNTLGLISKSINDTSKEDINLTNYLILSFTADPVKLNITDTSNLELKYQHYINGTISDLENNISLPLNFYTLNCSGGKLSQTIGILFNNISSTFISDLESGNINLTAIVNNQVLSLNLNVVNKAGIYGEDLIKVYGSNDTYTGVLIGSDGKPLTSTNLTLVLIRASNGEKKNYTVTTDSDGRFNLAINLYSGFYKVIAVYDNYRYQNTINVLTEDDDKDLTILKANRFNETYNAGSKFTGRLYNYDTLEAISNQTVSVNLTRLSDGASKIYNVTTNSNGEYQLPINLYAGQYRAYVTYEGSGDYQSSGDSALISVNPIKL